MSMILSEIEYVAENGDSVHSDLHSTYPISEDYRELLHKALDEWLDKAGNTGKFYVKGN
jgi:hypothetical protein